MKISEDTCPICQGPWDTGPSIMMSHYSNHRVHVKCANDNYRLYRAYTDLFRAYYRQHMGVANAAAG